MQTLFYRSNTGSAGVCVYRKNPMNIPEKTLENVLEWTPSDITKAKCVGTLELDCGEYFEILETKNRLVFGFSCNLGFIESGYILREDHESLDDTLHELRADLECYYRDGERYVSRIVCNERM